MSIQYDKEIFSNGNLILKTNFSGIKGKITNTSDLKMSIFAFEKNTGAPVFSEVLDFNEIKSLHEHLNQISIIKDSTQTTSGKFIETTGEILNILNGVKNVEPDILKTILDKFSEDEKRKGILKFLTEDEVEKLAAAHNYKSYETEIENLEKLLKLEEGNIVREIKKHEDLKKYIAGQPEKIFQNWIVRNFTWIFGINYRKKYLGRKIALFSEGDILLESIDGFLDLIELKRPKLESGLLKYDKNHKSYYPSVELSKVIGQCLYYLQKIEEYKPNIEKEYKTKIIRPRIKIIAGRTNKFKPKQFEALRMLNSNLSHIQIISYDYLLRAGKTIISDI